jgi:DNA-binding NarL/FixJ family response regulator
VAIRVVIADDHSVVREGLRMFLGRDPELEVVGETSGFELGRFKLKRKYSTYSSRWE